MRRRKLAARGLHVLHGRMHGRGEKKCDADFFQASGQARRRQVDVDAERFHHVGRTAFGSHAAIAVLGDAHARARDDERGRGGDVEGAAGIAAGAAGVDQRVALGAADVKRSHSGEASAAVASARIASAKPTISSTVSPFMCRATSSAAICASVLRRENFRHDLSRLVASERLAVVGDACAGRRGSSEIRVASSQTSPVYENGTVEKNFDLCVSVSFALTLPFYRIECLQPAV